MHCRVSSACSSTAWAPWRARVHRRLAGVPRGAAAAASLLDGLYGAKVRPADRPAEEGELSPEPLPQLP